MNPRILDHFSWIIGSRYLETTIEVMFCAESVFEIEKCLMLHPEEKIEKKTELSHLEGIAVGL